MGFESSIDAVIRRAAQEGAFDNLEGAGQPLEFVDTSANPAWWLSNKVREEGLELPAPEALAQRRELDDIGELTSEREVRKRLALLNVRIEKGNRLGLEGPQGRLMRLDIDAFVARWRVHRRG